MKTRSARLRPLAVLPVLLLACLGLTGCDSKAGTAAVVDGHRITEKDLSRYLPANAKPIPASDGSSTPARTVVLQILLRNQVVPQLLAASGSPVTDAQLAAARQAVLKGASEADVTSQVTKAGLRDRFGPVLLRNFEFLSLLDKLSQKQFNDALAKTKGQVSINPRYGSWDETRLALRGLGKKQLPSVLSVDTALPGDATQTQQ